MKIVKTIAEYKEIRDQLKQKTVGFVPTMGALHIGHASLIKRSIEQCDITVLSIFVNKTQFNNTQDLINYPDTMEKDLRLAEELGADIVFIPEYEHMFPDDFIFQVDEKEKSLDLCGKNRKGHFTGVLTVVMKLLNIVQAKRAYFGKKDYQQYTLIKQMVDAFFMDTEIVACETVREKDGLAYSSRNINIEKSLRKNAANLFKKISSNGSDEKISKDLEKLGFEIDYIKTLNDRRYAAVYLGEVRLIDNVVLKGSMR